MRRNGRESVRKGSEGRGQRAKVHAVDRLPGLRRKSSDPVERRKREDRWVATAMIGVLGVEVLWVVLILVSLWQLLS